MSKDYVYCGKKCIYCGSQDLVIKLKVGAGDGLLGVDYLKFAIPSREQIYADLCNNCGSVRMYVNNVNRDWR